MGDSTVIVALISAAFGGGGAAIITAIASWRKGVREQDVAEDQNALQGYKDLAAEYKSDLAALKTEMRETQKANADRFSRIEAELATERSTRWAAVQYARTLVAMILQHVPGATIPAPPESLADHIIIPPRKDPS